MWLLIVYDGTIGPQNGAPPPTAACPTEVPRALNVQRAAFEAVADTGLGEAPLDTDLPL